MQYSEHGGKRSFLDFLITGYSYVSDNNFFIFFQPQRVLNVRLFQSRNRVGLLSMRFEVQGQMMKEY